MCDLLCRQRPRILNKEAQIEILDQVAMCATTTLCTAAKLPGVSHESVQNVLKSNKVFLWKIYIFQELGDDDSNRRIQFNEIKNEHDPAF